MNPLDKHLLSPFRLNLACGRAVLTLCVMLVLARPAVAQEPERPAVAAAPVTASQEQFFENHVRPLLVDACVECHGVKKAESGLRLDVASGLLRGGDSGAAIDRENPDQSLLLTVVGYEGDIQMPPDGPLSAAQIEILREWVRQGAPWPGDPTAEANPMGLRSGPITDEERRHWAYQPVRKPAIPRIDLTAFSSKTDASGITLDGELADWAETDIDRFILADLLKQGLTPVADADDRQWLRRLTFDLTGLPPTPEDMRNFLNDSTPQARVKAIDRLLDSPHYGERWGRHWLDLVRYADTAGDGADYPIREAYKYRDYVIAAFNADKPYDQFLREQVAGDLLAHQAVAEGSITPDRFAELVTATGYIAMTKRFGYNINTAFQHLDIADTLDNLGQTVLGLSIGCARCHDHKYDAITAEDYYALYGIFASSRYSFPGGEEHKRPHDLVPLALPSEVAAAEQRVAGEVAAFDQQLEAIGAERAEILSQTTVGVSRDPGLELQTIGKPGGAPWFTAGPNTILAEAQSPYTHVYPAGSQGIRISHGKPTDGIRQEFANTTAANTPKFHFNLDFRNVEAVEGDGAYRFYLGHGAIRSLALECSVNSRQFSVRNGETFEVVRELEPGQWYNLQLTVDMNAKTFSGRIGRPGDVVAFDDFAAAPGWDGLLNTFVCDGYGQVQTASPTRDIDNVIGQAEPFQPLPESLPADATPESPGTDAAAELASVKSRLTELAAETERLTAARATAQASIEFPMAYGVSEGTPANVRLQRRGEPDRLGEEVPRRFLEILGGDRLSPDTSGSGRMELAEWLSRPSNPLTARVLVNRVWQQLFGVGLVDTPNDFGTRGESPSHPELLDFLAAEFMEDGWSIKRLQRRILTSRVYRLASQDTPELLAGDPANRRFGRHRRRPLDAESIRDAMLVVSGRLNRTPAGPHPFPDVNSWAFTIHYPFHAVYDSDHRSVYLMIQRSRRHPFLALFDAADPNISTATRQVTITPTQSLYLMNSPFVHAQAAGFAERLREEANTLANVGEPETERSIARAHWLAFGREPTADEVAQANAFIDESKELLRAAGDANDSRSAWEAYCRVLLTSNEFLYID
ncbi:MAG: DUF1553 domain-containing protein [Planctomycetaceae bacterium]|nr:MAG: DUF1553 domain-containing protein [Planctomycetaceae bacterium]